MRKQTNEDVLWKTAVIARDKKCVVCGTTAYLQAHHVNDYSHHPDQRLMVTNGATVCYFCHTLYHTSYNYSFREKTTRKDWENFLEMIKKLKLKKIV